MSLPVSGTLYDQVLDGYFGDTGSTVSNTSANVVFDDTYRSNLWVSYLRSVGLSETDPQLQSILTSTDYNQLKNSAVWKAFLANQGLPSSLDPDAPANATVGSFYWYKYLSSLGLSSDYSVTSLPPAQQAIFLGNFATYVTTTVSQFHVDFLAFAVNYQLNLEEGFVRFAKKTLFGLQNQAISLSPDEVKKREIMFNTFDILLKMLQALQNTVGAVGQNLIFFGKWQEAYTQMLTRVPIYTGGTSSAPHPIDLTVANPDYSAFTLGYNNISVEDIAKWYADHVQNGKTDTFIIASQPSTDIHIDGHGEVATNIALKMIILPDRSFVLQLVYQAANRDGTDMFDASGNVLQLGNAFQSQQYGPTGTGSTFDQDTSQFEAGFKDFFTNLPAIVGLNGLPPTANPGVFTFAIPPQYKKNDDGTLELMNDQIAANPPHTVNLNAIPVFEKANFGLYQGDSTAVNGVGAKVNDLTVPWDHVYVTNSTSNDTKLADIDAKARGEINARNQQYIENIRSLRDVVANNAKQIESSLSQVKESISQMGNLLTSILDSLKGIISSIFR